MTKITNVEPKSVTPEFMYVCPNSECEMEHYLTYKQVKTPGFMVVCDYCDTVFTPRLVKSVTVNFIVDEPPTPKTNTESVNKTIKPEFPSSKNFLKEAKETLIHFGFTKQEAEDMIKEQYKKTNSTSAVQLVKGALDFLGGKSE